MEDGPVRCSTVRTRVNTWDLLKGHVRGKDAVPVLPESLSLGLSRKELWRRELRLNFNILRFVFLIFELTREDNLIFKLACFLRNISGDGKEFEPPWPTDYSFTCLGYCKAQGTR